MLFLTRILLLLLRRRVDVLLDPLPVPYFTPGAVVNDARGLQDFKGVAHGNKEAATTTAFASRSITINTSIRINKLYRKYEVHDRPLIVHNNLSLIHI